MSTLIIYIKYRIDKNILSIISLIQRVMIFFQLLFS